MSVKRYRFTPRAESDLEDISTYTAERWSPLQAERYISSLYDAFDAVASGAETGRPTGLPSGARRLKVGSHVVFFTDEDQNTLLIVRILHQAMDFPRHL